MNNIALTGNMVRNPTSKTLVSGSTLCLFCIADNDGWKASEHVSFFECEAWGKTGEIIMQYLQKGDQVSVYGRMKENQWTDDTGNKKSKMSIVVANVALPRRSGRDMECTSETEVDTEAASNAFSDGVAPF